MASIRNKHLVCGDITLVFLERRDGEPVIAVVDTEDVPKIAGYKWHLKQLDEKRQYVEAHDIASDKLNKKVMLHRLLTDCPKGKVVDHRDGVTLNNRRNNLRVCTHAENLQNRSPISRAGASGLRGVTWSKHAGKWVARYRVKYKEFFLGYFDSKVKAAEAVIAARAEHMPFSQEAARREVANG